MSHSKYIHDDPVAMLKNYIATLNEKKPSPEHKVLNLLFKDVDLYIKILEEEKRMLLAKLS